MNYLGIDPGLGGGIGILDAQGRVLLADAMPVMASPVKNRRMVDAHGLYRLLMLYTADPLHAVVEQVGAMPRQGVTSSFSFGQSQGIVIGVLAGLHIGFEFVRPQTWKKTHGLINKDKRQAVAQVNNRWPELCLGKTADGIADALLMADWVRMRGVAA